MSSVARSGTASPGCVGFVGLGNMGAPMAANLVRAGYEVVGYNRSRAGVDRLVRSGGRGSSSVGEAVRSARFVITMLPDGPDVEEVMLAPGGILDSAPTDSLVIDMSTIPPATARNLSTASRARQIGFLDAPVSGGTQGAADGSLSVMVGGVAQDFQRARPLLNVLGDTVRHVGGAGAGQTVKAANQLIVAGAIELLGEAIVFLEASGAEMDSALETISGGLAGSTVLDRKGKSMIARDFTPSFRAALHHKDLGIVAEAARAAGVALPIGSLLAQLMGAVTAQGRGELDHSAILTIIDQLSANHVGKAQAPTAFADADPSAAGLNPVATTSMTESTEERVDP